MKNLTVSSPARGPPCPNDFPIWLVYHMITELRKAERSEFALSDQASNHANSDKLSLIHRVLYSFIVNWKRLASSPFVYSLQFDIPP